MNRRERLPWPLRVLRATVRLLFFLAADVTVTGWENIPSSGPYIIAINHMSKADPPLLFVMLPPVRLHFFAGEKWKKHFLFGPLMRWAGAIYINRGEVDRRALREALEALAAGSVFGLAPEGTRSKIGALIHARDGAAYLAARSGAPILPVGVVNTDRAGRNLARLQRSRLEMRIGRPFSLPELDQRPKGIHLAAYTHLIMVHIAALLPERHWGYYQDSPALRVLLSGQDPWPHCLTAAAQAAKVTTAPPAGSEPQRPLGLADSPA